MFIGRCGATPGGLVADWETKKATKKNSNFPSLETTKQNKTKKIHDLLKCLFVNITLSNIYTYIYIYIYYSIYFILVVYVMMLP